MSNNTQDIPTKELLSAVLGKEVAFDNNIQVTGDTVHYSNVTHMSKISIFKLADKCKKWAISQNCSIVSTFKHTFGHARVEWYEKGHFDKFGQPRELNFNSCWFKEKSEPFAVLSSSQWLLSQINKGSK